VTIEQRRIDLLCTVRGCGQLLAQSARALVCGRGHAFDVARSGYVNLLQPQDRRSREPGDSKAAVLARRRLVDAGHEQPIVDAVVAAIARLPLPTAPAIVDVGSGEGTFLARVTTALDGVGAGVDISVPAVEIAARSYPEHTWLVANADRMLPFPEGSFDVATSVTSRRHASELHRVVRRGGWLVVVVPAADDMVELRSHLHGTATADPRVTRVAAPLEGRFALRAHETVRCKATLDRGAIADVLATTYRGGRQRERERVEGLERLDVTLSRDVLVFARVETPSRAA
jgi:23S rRNA (guanine745-N1)-methyltransferase